MLYLGEKKMKYTIISLVSLLVSACGNNAHLILKPDPCTTVQVKNGANINCPDGTSTFIQNGTQGEQVQATPSPSLKSDIQIIVDKENEYRANVGYEPLVSGLQCTLYSVPTTTNAIIGATGLVYIGSWAFNGVFNQETGSVNNGLNILPVTIRNVYTSWYIVKCVGNLIVSDDNWHSFSLSSDDGANLYIDSILINNDGMHSAQTKTAVKYLKYGVHSFELDYLQGAGLETLILQQDGQVMQSNAFFH